MRYLFRSLAIVLYVICGALSPVLFGFHRWMIEEPKRRTSVILRKVRGVSGGSALFRGNELNFGGNAGLVGSMAYVGGFVLIGALLIGALTIGLMHPSTLHASMASGGLAVKLKNKQDELATKQKALHKVFETAGDDVDFTKPAVLELVGAKSSKEVVEKVRAMNTELEALGKERDEIAELDGIQKAASRRETEPAAKPPFPGATGDDDITKRRRVKSLGELIVGSAAFKEARAALRLGGSEQQKSMRQGNLASLEDGYGLPELKATFLTSAGWAPESLRTGLVVDKATRPLQVLDIIPAATTGMAVVKYMEETTRTHAGAERAENASYAESSFALTERSETVRSIGESVPVSDEQLEDVEGSQSYLEQRLGFGVRQRLDGQIVIGGGTGSDLTGVKNKSGIQTQAKGTDPIPDAIYKAMVLVRVTGRAFPNAVIMHPTNWQSVRLLRTADGIYIWGSPAEAGPERIWGIQVVQSDADSAGTAYVGDYANFCALYERKGLEVAIGYVNNDFLQGRRTIRAGLRVAFAIYRAAAFCSVTGL